ncbi:helix-turn-helix domain-containing protein [Tenacibaculum amylolyticum]|uniref:helix-turn-helix domain-containing protein n=1 Tax=Tenacibaculum amylolyticum TaxID=104269 RepID=UPI003894F1B7
MSTEKIPQIAFNPKKNKVLGVEIISIENLMSRNQKTDHSPEKAHVLKFNMIVLFTGGESEQLVDFVWHKVSKNTVIYLTRGQVNAFKFNKNLKGYLILFTNKYLEKQLNALPQTTTIRLLTSHLFSPKIEIPKDLFIKKYFHLFYKEFYKANETHIDTSTIHHLFVILFNKLERLKTNQLPQIKNTERFSIFLKFKELLESEYAKNRNADYYAKELHITYKHLNIICKEVVHATAKQFIDDFIILQAKRALINSTDRSSNIAYAMGFEEPTNFIKYFKKRTGYTPNAFKKIHS